MVYPVNKKPSKPARSGTAEVASMAVGSMARPVCHKRGERRRNGVVRGRHALVKAPTWFARTSKRLSDESDGPTPSEGIPRLKSWEDVKSISPTPVREGDPHEHATDGEQLTYQADHARRALREELTRRVRESEIDVADLLDSGGADAGS